MGEGSVGMVERGERTLCSAFGIGREDMGMGSGGKEDIALETASS